jgi:F-type H+-transporting ATPase subunit beta
MAEAKDILKDMPWVENPGGVGRVVRIVGPIVDVEFAPSDMPAIYNALIVDGETAIGHIHNVLEVQSHLGGDMVRTVAMDSTDGMTRGMAVADTGSPMCMPVGPQTLGRIWNVLGQPVDGKPMPEVDAYMPDPPSGPGVR